MKMYIRLGLLLGASLWSMDIFIQENKTDMENVMEKLWDRFCLWVAFKLPIRLVGWCYIRVIAHATCGQWSNSSITGLEAITALERWYVEHSDYVPTSHVLASTSRTMQQYTCPKCGDIGAHGKDSKAPTCWKCRKLGHIITMSKSHNGIICEYIEKDGGHI